MRLFPEILDNDKDEAELTRSFNADDDNASVIVNKVISCRSIYSLIFASLLDVL